MRYFPIYLALAFAFLLGCNPEGRKDESAAPNIIGSWQLFERGYSPGDRYVVEEVPSDPVQLIRFNEDSTLTSNTDAYRAFNRFQLVGENGSRVLVLHSASGESRSYAMSASEEKLELRAHGCIEGCHEAFRRVNHTIRE